MSADWSNNEVVRSQNWHQRLWRSLGFQTQEDPAETGLAEIFDEQLLDTRDALKHDKTTTVKKLYLNDETLVLKRYNARNTWHHLKRALRITRANRCWCMSYHFQRAGLNVAEPLVMLERRWGPLRKDAYLLTKCLEGQELLSRLPAMEEQERLQVKAAIDAAFAAMQAYKISHGDMKASNLLWVDERLFFVDLDAASKHRSRLSWRHAHNRDKQRWLKNWQDDPDLLALFEE